MIGLKAQPFCLEKGKSIASSASDDDAPGFREFVSSPATRTAAKPPSEWRVIFSCLAITQADTTLAGSLRLAWAMQRAAPLVLPKPDAL